MSTTTTNIGLTKPDTTDLALIGDINTNMDTLDGKWASTSPTTAVMSDSPDAGASTRIARADHRHGMPGFGVPVGIGSGNSEGVATTVSRSDHVHSSTATNAGWFSQGPWTFDLETSFSEDMRVYVPTVPTTATLILHGRSLRAGMVAAHTHSVTSNVSATGSSNSTGGESLTSGTQSADHTHGITASSTTGSDGSHNHNFSGTSHAHDLPRNGDATSPPWQVNLDPGAGTNASGLVQSTTATGTIDSQGAHTHSVSVNSDTGGVSATHTHSVSTSNHSHTVTVTVTNNAVTSGSAGSGGFTASTRPAGVSVSIDGTDRTVALGGSWGSSGADWDQEALNVLSYLQSTGWHTLTFSCTTGGRMHGQLILKL